MAYCKIVKGKPGRSNLSNLELAFEFVCPFIIREGAFYSNKVENLLVSAVVADMSPNQLIVPYHGPYFWLTLNQKIPLALYPVHFFLLKCSPSPRLVKDINHGFEQQEEKTFLFLS